jgi:HSP20 family protein
MQHTLKNHSTAPSNVADLNKTASTTDTHEQINAILDIDVTKSPSKQWIPAVDISETNDRFIIQADLPGIKTSDVDVKLRNGVLTFRGRRDTKDKTNGKNYFRLERSSGSFSRRFSLPDSVNSEKAKISSDEGVLTITIPKKTVIKPNKHDLHSGTDKSSHDKSTHTPHIISPRLMSNYLGM